MKSNGEREYFKDPITGRRLDGRINCLPFNRKVMDTMEMDDYFLGRLI